MEDGGGSGWRGRGSRNAIAKLLDQKVQQTSFTGRKNVSGLFLSRVFFPSRSSSNTGEEEIKSVWAEINSHTTWSRTATGRQSSAGVVSRTNVCDCVCY